MPVICFSRNVLRAVLSKCLAFVLRLSCVPVEMSCVRSRLLFAACAPNRTACGMFRSYSAVGRDRHSCVLGLPCGYRTWLVHFGLVRFFMAIPTGNEETRERGERSRRRGFCALLRNRIGLVILSAGSTLGLRAPNLRQRVFDSLDSLHAAAGLGWCVYAPSPGYTERPARAQFGAG